MHKSENNALYRGEGDLRATNRNIKIILPSRQTRGAPLYTNEDWRSNNSGIIKIGTILDVMPLTNFMLR
jgi:hypothetical protein